jgi:hypothetical protein
VAMKTGGTGTNCVSGVWYLATSAMARPQGGWQPLWIAFLTVIRVKSQGLAGLYLLETLFCEVGLSPG